jgi:hypothetical protein
MSLSLDNPMDEEDIKLKHYFFQIISKSVSLRTQVAENVLLIAQLYDRTGPCTEFRVVLILLV